MDKIYFGVAADDFTGASDAASFLAEAGVPTVLCSGIPEPGRSFGSGVKAVVAALKTRTAPSGQAVRETLGAFAALEQLGAEKFYLKYCSTFDSTAAGNIGPAADAVLDRYGLRCTVLCPSLPVNGRTVRGGILFVNGVPLAESPMKDHPLTPMRRSDVAGLMEMQSKYRAVSLSVDEWAAWKEGASRPESPDGRPFYIVPDYYEDAHADVLADVFGGLKFLTGGSGLLGALGRKYVREHGREMARAAACGSKPDAGWDPGAVREAEKPEGRALLLAGSCSAATLAQIENYREQGGTLLRIDPRRMLDGTQTVDQIRDFLDGADSSVLVYSSAPPDEIREIQKLGKEKTAAVVEQTLSGLAVEAARRGTDRIIVAGGETSGAVTKALGLRAFTIGRSVAPGVPVMIPVDRPSMRIVLKSGNFGQEDFFRRALALTEN